MVPRAGPRKHFSRARANFYAGGGARGECLRGGDAPGAMRRVGRDSGGSARGMKRWRTVRGGSVRRAWIFAEGRLRSLLVADGRAHMNTCGRKCAASLYSVG